MNNIQYRFWKFKALLTIGYYWIKVKYTYIKWVSRDLLNWGIGKLFYFPEDNDDYYKN